MIRDLRKQDTEEVIALLQRTKNFSDAEIEIARELIDIVTTKPEQEDYFASVAEVETDNETRRIAGFLLLGPTPATTGTYDMYWIAAHPDFQGQGIAQKLDEYAVRFVRERKGYWLIAETSSQPGYERTRGFYTKQGYQALARIPDYYKPGDDLIIFGKRV
ncbi:MAG: N-acetyltransferase [Bacteroidota bacterium]|nr:N-acetyltransferase [Bacteroidota bacterium]MDP4234769.1 N-acetyltransferase [Bacteroidota bacterium]MDP4244160.1 N-acetyltransferase [Bacteroidota bacterium]MDP4289322.1 N-acetyltransferase [Bacteroidota bacterium]